MKVIAFYLPQFHEIPENSEWWGNGFTDWVNVKKAIRLKDGQNQPRVPLNDNYYDLSDPNVMRWQAELAKKYGIYGFCIYHYWFNGHKLLEKPAENLLVHKDIDIFFCFSWANENWSNHWLAGTDQKVLIEQKYGDKAEWRKHFDYLLPFFQDERYIKEKGKPLMIIYRPELLEAVKEMLDYWDDWAREAGFKGICFAYQKADGTVFNYANGRDAQYEYQIEYQPAECRKWANRKLVESATGAKRRLFRLLNKILHTEKYSTVIFSPRLAKYDYDRDWNIILNHEPESPKCVPGAFVDWDNTPRMQVRGSYYKGVTPEKFAYYFEKLVYRAVDVYKKDMIFMFAWNEWAEGGYLEPDEKNGYGYLEAIYNVLKKTDELPE